MKDYLNLNGLTYFVNKLLAKFTEMLNGKVDKVDGKGLSTNDYTTEEKEKLARIPNNSVTSVNGKQGEVTLTYSDVGAANAVHKHTKEEIIGLEDVGGASVYVTDDGNGNVTIDGIISATTYETRLNSLETEVSTLNSNVETLSSVINGNDILVANN